MTDVFSLDLDRLDLPREAVFELQGIPAHRSPSENTVRLCDSAHELLAQAAQPAGILRESDAESFAAVYRGEGQNEPDAPVADIFPLAERLALFAVTLGPRVGEEISRLFDASDMALACMLDSVASVAADALAEFAQRRHLQHLRESDEVGPGARALRYSPGYCGWHITGQRALFGYLNPERIGVSLRESYLMEPLKSVSGVILVGPQHIHEFDNSYPFCEECLTHGCRTRIGALSNG